MSAGKLKNGIFSILIVAAGVTVIVLQQRDTTALRGEIEQLRGQKQENARLSEENRRLTGDLAQAVAEAGVARDEHAELVRLRAEVDALKKASARAGAAGVEKASAMVPVAAMGNAGRATPRAAGQTEAWAMRRGDIDTVASLITFGPEERAKMEALVAALPDNLREQYGTPERLMALLMTGMPRPVAAVQVVDEAEDGPDDYIQHVQLQYADGRTRTDELSFHREAEGWSLVMSPAIVDRAVAALKNGPPPSPPASGGQ